MVLGLLRALAHHIQGGCKFPFNMGKSVVIICAPAVKDGLKEQLAEGKARLLGGKLVATGKLLGIGLAGGHARAGATTDKRTKKQRKRTSRCRMLVAAGANTESSRVVASGLVKAMGWGVSVLCVSDTQFELMKKRGRRLSTQHAAGWLI